jgi:hypothetical protein
VHDYLLETTLGGINELENKKEISKYKRFLYSELWSVPNPIDQLNIAFEKAQNDFHTSHHVLHKLIIQIQIMR